MSQGQWIVLALRIVLISGFVSILTWIAVYSKLARWWSSPIGRTLVAKSLLIAGMFVPSILALFFHLSKTTSYVAGWVDVGLIGLVTPVMTWRSLVWVRESRKDRTPAEEEP